MGAPAIGVLVAVGADVLVAVSGAGVDEGLGATVGVVITAGPQAMRVKSRNRDVSFFMFPSHGFPSHLHLHAGASVASEAKQSPRNMGLLRRNERSSQ
jgi:hypothetical protein